MAEQMIRIVSCRVNGNKVFNLGQKGCIHIEVNPPIVAIHFEDEILLFFSPTEQIEWKAEKVEQPNIVVPEIVPPEDVSAM